MRDLHGLCRFTFLYTAEEIGEGDSAGYVRNIIITVAPGEGGGINIFPQQETR